MNMSRKCYLMFYLFMIAGCTIEGRPTATIDQAIQEAAEKSTDLSMMQDDNTILAELDMRFTQSQWAEIQRMRRKGLAARVANSFGLRNQSRWTDGQVPYVLSDGFSARDVREIRLGVGEWNKYSCVNIRPYRRSDRNYIQVVPTGGCSSMVGMTGWSKQKLTLGRGCRSRGIVAHEFGHALGFHHEQTRANSDRYVYFRSKNTWPSMRINFRKYNWTMFNSYNVPYDYKSIMHYGQYAFSINQRRTIITTDRPMQNVIGNRYSVSFYDVKLANLMYSCNRKCSNKKCPGSGFVGKNCRCWCQGPSARVPVIDCKTKKAIGGGITVGPIPTRRPNPTRSKGDLHPNCPTWARRGDCRKNPGYMLRNCKFSCRGTVPSCRDKRTSCPSWKRRGYCKNKIFKYIMLRRCRRSCGFCS